MRDPQYPELRENPCTLNHTQVAEIAAKNSNKRQYTANTPYAPSVQCDDLTRSTVGKSAVLRALWSDLSRTAAVASSTSFGVPDGIAAPVNFETRVSWGNDLSGGWLESNVSIRCKPRTGVACEQSNDY